MREGAFSWVHSRASHYTIAHVLLSCTWPGQAHLFYGLTFFYGCGNRPWMGVDRLDVHCLAQAAACQVRRNFTCVRPGRQGLSDFQPPRFRHPCWTSTRSIPPPPSTQLSTVPPPCRTCLPQHQSLPASMSATEDIGGSHNKDIV